MNKNIVIGLLIFVGILAGFFLPRPTFVQQIQEKIGVASGGVFDMPVELHSGLSKSSVLATSTVGATATLKEKDLQNYDTINYAFIGTSGTTLTLPASSTLTNMIKAKGATQKTCIFNATSTAQNITIAAGTGIDLVSATSTLTIATGQYGCLNFIRQSDSDVTAIFEKYYNAD